MLKIVVLVLIIIFVIDELVQRSIINGFYPFPLGLNYEKKFPEIKCSKTWKTDSIPKIIHQTAPRDKKKWHEKWFNCQKTWKKNFPDFEYILWTDEDLEEFIRTKFEWFYPTYMGYDANIKRIDAARYFILYEYGGIYADMDYECLQNFEEFLMVGKVSLGESLFRNNKFIMIEKYQNALISSPAKHPFWKHVIYNLELTMYIKPVVYATGPYIINKTSAENSDMINSLPYEYFYKGGFAKHHQTSVWIPSFMDKFVKLFYNVIT